MTGGSKGDKVRELQHRLRQLDWYAGSVSGTYGSGTEGRRRGLPGEARKPDNRGGRQDHLDHADVDDPQADQRRDAQPLVPGRPCSAGATGDRVRDLQARLKQIGWFSGA